jgi:glycine/D-amino acid oxidase-like deaminating enzyme
MTGDEVRLRIVVVGAGVTGLLTAIRWARAGHRVVVLDRGSIPDPAATSFDQHRALRALTVGDPVATHRAGALHRRWIELDHLLRPHPAAERLYQQVGVLTALRPDEVPAAVITANAAGLPLRIADPACHPHLGVPAGAAVVFEPHAGMLLADRILHAAAGWLRRHPLVELRPGQEVVDVRPSDGRVLLADGGIESGDVTLIAAGPWSAALTDLPVTLHRQTTVHLRAPADLVRRWTTTPVTGGLGSDGRGWALPPVAGTLLKISTDAARREVTALSDQDDAKTPWRQVVLSAGIVSEVDRYDVVAVRYCHYATAADGDTGFVQIGPAVWARPASGGDGFRTAPHAVDAMYDVLFVTGPPVARTSHPTSRTSP